MSSLISARVPEATAERIRQYARRKQRSINEVVSTAVEEWLRLNDFALIEFRDTPDGRVAYMKGSRLPVYWVVKVALGYDLDVDKTVAYWNGQQSREWVQAALNYYEAFPDEIDAQIADAASQTFDTLKRKLPQLHLSEVKLPAETLEENA
ncbi:MAG: hypothetical protein JWL77_6165 [Chthonomonadaceae bacterium]|nr:hypothetical protein [Chthonomonadaceae bacterium]